jgi:hypothetical protein
VDLIGCLSSIFSLSVEPAVSSADEQCAGSSVTVGQPTSILIVPKDVLFIILCFLGEEMEDVFSVISACHELRRRSEHALNKCAQVLFGKPDGSALQDPALLSKDR